MIRLATVFSGIGAIEQAMLQKELEHEIVFACDNGDICLDIDYDEEFDIVKKTPIRVFFYAPNSLFFADTSLAKYSSYVILLSIIPFGVISIILFATVCTN